MKARSPIVPSSLHRRWTSLWKRLGATGTGHRPFADLVRRYGEPHRAYHTFAHVAQALAEFDRARHLCPHPDSVETALWFHDAVYDPRGMDNEDRSAVLAGSVLRRAGVPDVTVRRVCRLIRQTASHRAPPGDADAAVLCDADLSILGRPRAEFDRYERGVRREYSFVPEDAYRKGRSRILARLLKPPGPFATLLFRRKYGPRARRNLRRSLRGRTGTVARRTR